MVSTGKRKRNETGNPAPRPTITFGGRQIPLRTVGQVFDAQNRGLAMLLGWQTLASADTGRRDRGPGRDHAAPLRAALMASSADLGLPASILNVYGSGGIAALALAGVMIAVAAALLPAAGRPRSGPPQRCAPSEPDLRSRTSPPRRAAASRLVRNVLLS